VTRVVIAHESEGIREAVRLLLEGAGYRVTVVPDGRAAVEALEPEPAGLVLDVAVPDLMAYEVVEAVRQRGLKTKIVLIASIYNRTGYKRRPTSLYGADDYVEQHHIPDSLVDKLERLIGRGAAPARGSTVEGAHKGRIRSAGEGRLEQVQTALPTPALIERAERLARLIVADIALYNGDAIDAAAQALDTSELDARLRLDLEEGRLLFDLRVPATIRRTRDFIAEALAELRARRVAGNGGAP
jgi:CheY-like chemotaxis protein